MTTGSTTIITKSLLSGLLTNTDRGLVLPPSHSQRLFFLYPRTKAQGAFGGGDQGIPHWLAA